MGLAVGSLVGCQVVLGVDDFDEGGQGAQGAAGAWSKGGSAGSGGSGTGESGRAGAGEAGSKGVSGGPGAGGAMGECAKDEDCAARVPLTSPEGCAVGKCDASTKACVFVAKDADGDTFGTKFCSSLTAAPVAVGDDCDDAKSDVYPAAKETCNNVDDNCNDEVDENVVWQDFLTEAEAKCVINDNGPQGVPNMCRAEGHKLCSGGTWSACDAEVIAPPKPADAPTCDGNDWDCNGKYEGCPCTVGEGTLACTVGAGCPGTQTCVGGNWATCQKNNPNWVCNCPSPGAQDTSCPANPSNNCPQRRLCDSNYAWGSCQQVNPSCNCAPNGKTESCWNGFCGGTRTCSGEQWGSCVTPSTTSCQLCGDWPSTKSCSNGVCSANPGVKNYAPSGPFFAHDPGCGQASGNQWHVSEWVDMQCDALVATGSLPAGDYTVTIDIYAEPTGWPKGVWIDIWVNGVEIANDVDIEGANSWSHTFHVGDNGNGCGSPSVLIFYKGGGYAESMTIQNVRFERHLHRLRR